MAMLAHIGNQSAETIYGMTISEAIDWKIALRDFYNHLHEPKKT